MKIIARLMGLTAIGLLFIGILINIMQENILLRDLTNMTSLAVNQTQIVMKEQIEDQYYNYANARTNFADNDAYFDYFKQCFKKLITSDAKYEVALYDIDYTKGLISVRVDCKYKNLAGIEKTLYAQKTSIVDVLIDADVSESIIPDTETRIVTPPTLTLYSYTYDGSDHLLADPGAVTGGTIYYGYSRSSTEKPTNYSTQLPTGKDAGVYCVWFKIKNSVTGAFEHENYIGTATINPREVTITWSGDTWVYSGENHSATVLLGNTIASDNVTVNVDNNTIKNVGSKNVMVTGITNSNYVLPLDNLIHQIEVTPAPVEVYMHEYRTMYSESTPYRYATGESPEENPSPLYDERTHRINGYDYYVTGLCGEDTLYGIPNYWVETLIGSEISNIATASVGTYNVFMDGLSNENYSIHYNPSKLVIHKLRNYMTVPTTLSISIPQAELSGFGTQIVPECTLFNVTSGAINYCGNLTYQLISITNASGVNCTSMVEEMFKSGTTLKFRNIDTTNPGNYTITLKVTCDGDSNHEAEEQTLSVKFKIERIH